MAVVVVIFLAIWIPLALRQWLRRGEARSFVSQEDIGTAGGCEVCVAASGGRRFVELVVREQSEGRDVEVHFYVTASQARLLAAWARLAAAPGRTLAEARRRSRRAPT